MTKILDLLDSIFITPEGTKAGCSFGDMDMKISFNEANIVFFGIPLELTTSFGKGTSRGPEAIRSTSGRQIETYVYDEKKDIKEIAKIFDLGDVKLPQYHDGKIDSIFSFLDEKVPPLVKELSRTKKKPFVLGGEHTLSYFCFKGLSETQPLLIHFDPFLIVYASMHNLASEVVYLLHESENDISFITIVAQYSTYS